MSTETLPGTFPDDSSDIVADEPLWEVVHGQRVEKVKVSGLSNLIKSCLVGLLWPQVTESGLGRLVTETVFILDDAGHEQRRPDLAFVSYERWPKDRKVLWVGEWKVVPDLCIEITSPTDPYYQVLGKVHELLDLGVREVWVVTPTEKVVSIHRSRTDVTSLTSSDILTSELLPGVEVPLADVFAEV